MSSPAEAVGLDRIAARVRAAVESVAASDPNPTDPFRGLYVTDELALAIARSDPALDPDARLLLAVERLGLDAVDAAVDGRDLVVAAEQGTDPLDEIGQRVAMLGEYEDLASAAVGVEHRLLIKEKVT